MAWAGGIKDVGRGDVVASTKVYAYEAGKVVKGAFEPRPEVAHTSHSLESRAMAVARKGHWVKRIPSRYGDEPKAIVAPIVAGEKVIATANSPEGSLIRESYGDAVAVDKEYYGLLEAARVNPHVVAIAVRGISDLLDDKAKSDRQGWPPIAARHAAAFAFELLSAYGLTASSDGIAGPHRVARPIKEDEYARLSRLQLSREESWDLAHRLMRIREESRDESERYWVNVTLGNVGQTNVLVSLKDGLSDRSEFARRGAEEGLSLLQDRGVELNE